MKKSILLVFLILVSLLLFSCSDTQDDTGFTLGYELEDTDEPTLGAEFGVKSDQNVFEINSDIILQIGIGIPSSAFFEDKDTRIDLVMENILSNEREILYTIDEFSMNDFEFTTTKINRNTQMIEYTYEHEISLSSNVFSSYTLKEGYVLIGFEVIIVNENNDEVLHFSTFQRLFYQVNETSIILSKGL